MWTSRALRTVNDTLARQYPENHHKTVAVTPPQQRLTGDLQATLWVLMSAVCVVWLIACANIANLLLARAADSDALDRASRRARRWPGPRDAQLLTERCVLASVAGVAGLLLASMLVRGLVALSPANVPRIDDVRIDTVVLLFSFGLSLVSTVLFGLVPAVHGSRLDLSDALKQGGSKMTTSRVSSRLRAALVVTEVALSVVLPVTAGLLVRSFQALQHVHLGFTTDRVLVAYTEYAVKEDLAETRTRSSVYAEVLDRRRAVPGVRVAAGVAYLGMGRERREPRDYLIQGRSEGQPGERSQAELHAITADDFKTLQIPVRAGREFDRTDSPERPAVAIINETTARAAFPGESPIGERIRTTEPLTSSGSSSAKRCAWSPAVSSWDLPVPLALRRCSRGFSMRSVRGMSVRILVR